VTNAERDAERCAFCWPPPEVPDFPHQARRGAFVVRPLRQETPGHLLVVTGAHLRYLWELPAWELVQVTELVRDVARWQVDHGAHGVNVLHASGQAAGQSVLHAHWHVVPRLLNDGRDLWFR